MSKRIVVVVGTRPEAIKMAPVYRALTERPAFEPVLVSTGQHTDLLRSALSSFGLTPDFELGVMTPGQSLTAAAARILERFDSLLSELAPAAVLVQGDTTTAFAAGLAAFYAQVPVGHVEAGLRTYDFDNPFPEEANRQLVDRISTWCFAPTEGSKENLLGERIDAKKVHVTGNTGIDALLWALERAPTQRASEPFVLLTLHRRESFGAPLEEVLLGVLDFLRATPEAHVLWPVHPNPAVKAAAADLLHGNGQVRIVAPQDYLTFARWMVDCRLILTDSGGIQEEAPSLGKRVLVARETTERPEAIQTGQNRLIGRQRGRITQELCRAWSEPPYDGPVPAKNPFGDGQASRKVVEALVKSL
jgi:UDP-N-acetylglucosamine 2-epimerase (non-hydrolysing)